MTDYKKYSLGQVENFLYDAMSTDATPQEIYDTIKGVVENNYYTYKTQTTNAYELLALLNGNGKGHIEGWDAWEETHYPEEVKDDGMRPWGHSDLEYHVANKKDKVKKWILPVEMDGPSAEYFVTFPDDLLEAANLKEGDQIKWVDQGDGSYLLKKVPNPSWVRGNELAKVKTYQEMIDDGWEMTDDGFWIKE